MDGDPVMDRETSLLLEEWKEIREALRYFGNKRFAQLTVFIAASGFMLDAFLGRTDATTRVALSVVGVVLGVLFLAMELSSVRYWKKFAERGRQIEWATDSRLIDLGRRMKGLTNSLWLMREFRPREGWFSATRATYTVYLGVILLWVVVLVALILGPLQPPQDPAKLIAEALSVAPAYAGDERSPWQLRSMTWEEASRTYRIVLHERTADETISLTLDGGTGRVKGILKTSN